MHVPFRGALAFVLIFSACAACAASLAQQPVQLHSRETTRVTVSPDGRSITTETTRSSIGVNPAGAPAPARGVIPAPSPSYHGGLPGVWQAHSSSNRATCSVLLYGGPSATSGGAKSQGCPSGSLSGLTGWRYVNGRMELLKGDQVSLGLSQLGPNRFDGKLSWGPLTTTISLYR